MGIGAILGGVGSLIGAGSSIAGLANQPSYSASQTMPYIPQAQGTADQLYQAIFNQMAPYAAQVPGQVIPQYQQLTQNILQNPYAAMAQQGAGAVSAADLSAAGALSGAGGQVLGTAFDPQSALYNQLQQQTVDQANAMNAMYGLSASPYGAGVANQALQNFNIAWQNQQLQREQQGIQAAGQAYTGASALGQTGAALPYSTYLGQQQAGLGALGQLTGGYSAAFGPQESLANLLQSYLGMGQSATGLAQLGQQASFQQQQQLGQQLATALSNPQLAQLFGGGGGYSTLPASQNPDYAAGYGAVYPAGGLT